MQSQTASYVITTLLTPPKTGDLVSVDAVKRELSILCTSSGQQPTVPSDETLKEMIEDCSAAIARYVKRIFGLGVWQDEFRLQRGVGGEGVRGAYNPLQLTRWPLAAGATTFTGNLNSTRSVLGIASTEGLTQGQPIFGTGIPAGTTISGVQPYSIQLSQAATVTATAQALTAGLQVQETLPDGTVNTLVAGTDYQVDMGSRLPGDEGASRLYRLNERGQPRTWRPLQTVVIYQAGYRLPCDGTSCGVPLPADIRTACLRFVTMRFAARGRDPFMTQWEQPGLGTQRFWIGNQPGQDGALPPEIASLLSPMRPPTMASA